MRADHADLLTRLPLVADVDMAGRIVADEDGCQAGLGFTGGGPLGDRGGDLGLHGLGEGFAVEQSGGHEFQPGERRTINCGAVSDLNVLLSLRERNSSRGARGVLSDTVIVWYPAWPSPPANS